MNKKLFHTIKTQVTAFIIVGILIIAIVWGALYISEYFAKKDLEKFAPIGQQLTLESNTIKENIDTCIQSLTDKGMQLMSDQGLYLEIPENYTYNEHAYWLKNTINIMPSSFEKIDQELAYYINTNLPNCVNLDEFKENGWDISPFVPFTTAQIHKEDVGIEVKYTINVKKQDFEREFSNSIYTPKIRFRQMYGKSVEFINDQLLSPDFDFNNPLEDYNTTGYTINHEKLDDQTLLFSIIDTQSKLLDGKPFTLKFAADFNINNIPRTYDVSDINEFRLLFSPDRLAVLILQPGVVSSSDKITIRQYEKDFVTRRNTPIERVNWDVTQTTDITIPTEYPIYQFSPIGTNFSQPTLLTIFLNKDQREIPSDYTLWWNGRDGWLPYPHIKNITTGTISAFIYGFSGYTVGNCNLSNLPPVIIKDDPPERGWWDTYGSYVKLALALALAFTPLGPFLLGLVGQVLGVIGGAIGGFLSGAAEVLHLTSTVVKVGKVVKGIGSIASTVGTAISNAPGAKVAGKIITKSGIGNIGKLFTAEGISLTAAAVSGYSAYQTWGGIAKESEDSLVFNTICDDGITITKEYDGGECGCFISNLNSEEQAELKDGDTYSVYAGESYLLVAKVKEFDKFERKAWCECTAKGKITTSKLDPAPEPEPEPEPGELFCCITDDGFCLDNYEDKSCYGEVIEKSCDNILSCDDNISLSGEGNLQIASVAGDPAGFGIEGDSFLISYDLPSAADDTLVIAHIKIDGTLTDSITLYDDGTHDDGARNDKQYANTWRSRNILENQNSAEITWDIEVRYGNVRTSTIDNAGSTRLTNINSDCQPMEPFLFDNSLDIILAANNYNSQSEFNEVAGKKAQKILSNSVFRDYSLSKGINFYKLTELFSTSSLSQIKNKANNKCDYTNAPRKLIVVLNNEVTRCTQTSNIVQLNPLFTLKSEIPNINTAQNNFCTYVNELNLLNPPNPVILTNDLTTTPGFVDFEFQITDEEYPIDYKLEWNFVTLKESRVMDDSIHKHTLNLPNGDWKVQIIATDQRGVTASSNLLSILVDDTMQLDLSSISPFNILSNGSKTINLNDYLDNPSGDPIVAWTYSPAFSECISFNPATITNGQVTLTHIKDSACTISITFEAINSNSKRASDTIDIEAG